MVDGVNQLDIELLEGYFNNLGKEIVQQMLDLYLQQSSIYMNEINDAICRESQEDWCDRCHKMKGAAGSVGFLQVHSKLVAIEKSEEPWVMKTQWLKELKALNDLASSAFENWLTSQ